MSLIGRAESRLLRLLLVLITLLMAQPAAADVADGVRAFRAQDYATAYRLLLPAAEAGDREAQYWLSMVLDIGSGIGGSSKEANRAAADVWRRKAAKQGHAKALAELGQIYHESFQFDLAFEYSLKAAQADGRSGTWKIGLPCVTFQ